MRQLILIKVFTQDHMAGKCSEPRCSHNTPIFVAASLINKNVQDAFVDIFRIKILTSATIGSDSYLSSLENGGS